MPKYTVTFNVKLDQQLEISINANNQLDASDAADVIAYEIASDPGFLVDNLQLECTSVEPEAPTYTRLTNASSSASAASFNQDGYTSLASLYAQEAQPCDPCQGSLHSASSYTRLT